MRTAAITYSTPVSSGTGGALADIMPPAPGARVLRWWVSRKTVGTGTATSTIYLVKSGGTSSTSAISGSIAMDIDSTTVSTYIGEALNPPAYEFTKEDMTTAIDVVVVNNTTQTNAPTGLTYGVLWAL